MSPKFTAALNPNESTLDAGLEGSFGLLDPSPCFATDGCGWLRRARDTGGRDYSQTQWNYTTLASTFMKNGNALAHVMGNKHPGYSHESTEELWARKLRERSASGGKLGWPSCSAIRKAGGRECKACPHWGKIKFPLDLALPTRAKTDINNSLNHAQEININPVAALMQLRDQGADINTILAAINQTFAVVKYGSKIMVASIIGKDLDFLKLDDFHNMLANLVVTSRASKSWFGWKDRRQYLGRGVVFEPGGPLQIPNDLLNLWRGFGVEPKQGDWSLMRNHIRDVICSGNEEHFQYLIKWMAYGVRHPDRPIGVAVALRGEEGAGKGFVWRNYGKLFGKHFKHVAHGEHLTGRFNAVLAEACTVFLDEALWAGDRKGEQILKALVTEDTFQLERKFCDPIPVKNRLRIMIASNNQWIVPVSTRGRRYFVLDVSDQYADESDPAHAAYWGPLQEQFGDYAPDDGRAAMLHDLLHTDLSGFNVRAVPQSAAKTEQKLLTQTGTEAWLFEILQDGAVTKSSYGHRCTVSKWDANGMQISLDDAYDAYLQSSQERREYRPRSKEWWSRDLREIMKGCVSYGRPRTDNPHRGRMLTFRPLEECRAAYAKYMHADDIDWESVDEPDAQTSGNSDTDADIEREHDEMQANPDIESERDETDVDADIEWPDPDDARERELTDDPHPDPDLAYDLARERALTTDDAEREPDPDADFERDPADETNAEDSSDADVVQGMPRPL